MLFNVGLFTPGAFAARRRVRERALIGGYRDVIERRLAMLEPGNHDVAVRVAALPGLVRGYEGGALTNVERYRAELAGCAS